MDDIASVVPPQHKLWKILLALSGAIPLLFLFGKPPDTTLLGYTVFVLVYFSHASLQPMINRIGTNIWIKFLLLAIGAGLITECLAWTGNYLAHNLNPALFHPQLAYDLLLATGFYAGNALAWILALQRYQFSLGEVFVIQGIFGVFIEQQGAVFRAGLDSFPFGLLYWAYVFLVYGSFIGFPYILIEPELTRTQKSKHWARYLVAIGLIWIITLTFSLLWGLPLHWLQAIPDPLPIWERPFW